MVTCLGKLFRFSLIVVAVLSLSTCKSRENSNFIAARADRSVSGASAYPIATDPGLVGTYPPETKSGGGFFYDDVLEYRVWLHPENSAKRVNAGSDYFVAFAQYEKAEEFATGQPGAEAPLVLVRQLEWIDEPEPQHYIRKKGARVTEWRVRWLSGSRRKVESIDEFLKHPRPASE
jgi:hypothetical protein